MNKEQILETLRKLSQCQGFYGRILRSIEEEDLEFLEQQNFKTSLDLIMFLET